MSREAKKLVYAAIVTLALARCVKATLVDSNSIVEDGIEYYIQTDKFVYDLGENVEMLLSVTNLRNEEWTFGYMPPALDILVAAKEGGNFNTVWFWSWDGIWPAGPKLFRLQPGESVELNGIWPQIDLNGSWEIEDHIQVLLGTYRIGSSGFNDIINNSSVTVEITIIPEPGSLLLLGLGGLILRKAKLKPKR